MWANHFSPRIIKFFLFVACLGVNYLLGSLILKNNHEILFLLCNMFLTGLISICYLQGFHTFTGLLNSLVESGDDVSAPLSFLLIYFFSLYFIFFSSHSRLEMNMHNKWIYNRRLGNLKGGLRYLISLLLIHHYLSLLNLTMSQHNLILHTFPER
jgi:hypothetical protein